MIYKGILFRVQRYYKFSKFAIFLAEKYRLCLYKRVFSLKKIVVCTKVRNNRALVAKNVLSENSLFAQQIRACRKLLLFSQTAKFFCIFNPPPRGEAWRGRELLTNGANRSDT